MKQRDHLHSKREINAINEGKSKLKKSRQTSKRHISKALAIKVQILTHIRIIGASLSNEDYTNVEI